MAPALGLEFRLLPAPTDAASHSWKHSGWLLTRDLCARLLF